MKLFKKIYDWEKKQLKNSETIVPVSIALGTVIGIGMDNVGVGIALGLAIGTAMYAQRMKATKKEDDEDK